jgi:FdhE protein
MVRIKCSSCESTRGISYYELEGSNGAIKAECCDECYSYLKLFYMEKDHRVEPVADDLATLALDVLMDETGRARGGPNLFFIRAASESDIQVLSRNIVTPVRCSH